MPVRCLECGDIDPLIHTVDDGIGPYEYCGAIGFHSVPVDVTRCCEASTVDDTNEQALHQCINIKGMKTSDFIFMQVPDAMLKEAVAAWLKGDREEMADLFEAACEKGFEDAVDLLDAEG